MVHLKHVSYYSLSKIISLNIPYICMVHQLALYHLIFYGQLTQGLGLPSGSVVKNLPAMLGSTIGSGRSPGKGNGYPFQYSCLENPMDRGTWQNTVHWVSKSWTWLSDWAQGTQDTCIMHLETVNDLKLCILLIGWPTSTWPNCCLTWFPMFQTVFSFSISFILFPRCLVTTKIWSRSLCFRKEFRKVAKCWPPLNAS